MLIKKVHIEKFRGFHDQEFEVGSMLTAIAGQNGTQKSTLLGMITQTFTLGKDKNPMGGEKPLCGGNYRSAFSDKFRLPSIDVIYVALHTCNSVVVKPSPCINLDFLKAWLD